MLPWPWDGSKYWRLLEQNTCEHIGGRCLDTQYQTWSPETSDATTCELCRAKCAADHTRSVILQSMLIWSNRVAHCQSRFARRVANNTWTSFPQCSSAVLMTVCPRLVFAIRFRSGNIAIAHVCRRTLCSKKCSTTKLPKRRKENAALLLTMCL